MSDQDDAADALTGLYAKWIMEQPDAPVSDGSSLLTLMESGWRLREFIAVLPEQIAKEIA